MTYLLAALGVYAALGLAVGCVAYQAVDPYGHFGRLRNLGQAALYGALWLPLLLYVVGAAAWYALKDD